MIGSSLQGPLRRGELIGERKRYRIERALGRGGFGEAYLAFDILLDRSCVIKRLLLDERQSPEQRQRLQTNFQREALLQAGLNVPGHPNIPEIYEVLPECSCLVLKFIDGQNLDQLLDRRLTPLPEAEALRYMRDICSALVYLHSRTPVPVLHRDIKPSNILLDAAGRVWLIDFGLAKALAVAPAFDNPYSSRAMGTLGYTPPEQWRGSAEPRSDVFALGVTLHTLLTSYQLTPAEQLALMRGEDALPALRQLRPDVTAEAEELVVRATRPNVEERPTASELLELLDQLIEQSSVAPPPLPLPPPLLAESVGRGQELKQLGSMLETYSTAMISGPAGVGKTTLAAILASQLRERPQLFWHTFAAGEGVETLVWALAGFLAHRQRGELWKLLQRGRRVDVVLPPFETISDYLVQQLRGQQLVICIDDIQLVEDDPQFGRLLRQLYAEAQAGQIGLLLVGRRAPSYVPVETTLALRGLAAAEARALLAARGLTLTDGLFNALYNGTEGNPQFLLLAQIALSQSTEPQSQIERLAAAEDIERYILREVDSGLTVEARNVLRAIAVLGDDATRPTLEALLEQDGLQRTLRVLIDNNLLVSFESVAGRSYRLHAILQAFYYDQLRSPEQRRLHRRAGVYYEHEAADPVRAARHFSAAGDMVRAARLLTGDVRTLLNTGRAQALCRQLEGLKLVELDTSLRIDVQIALGEVYALLRAGGQARSSFMIALEQVEALPPSQRSRRQARIGRGMGELLEAEAPQKALQWLWRGLAALGDSGNDQELRYEEALLRLRVGAVFMALGSYDEALRELDATLQLLPGEASHWHASALMNRGSIACMRGDTTTGLADYQQALSIYERRQNVWGLIGIRHNQAIELEIAGRWEEAAASYQQANNLAQSLQFVAHQAAIELGLGILRTKQGNFDEAHRHLEQSLRIARDHALAEELVCAQSSLADLYVRREEWERAEQLLHVTQQRAANLQITHALPEIARNLALLYLARHQLDDAQLAAEQAVQLAQQLGSDIDEGASLRVLGQTLVAREQDEAASTALVESLALLDERDPYEASRTRFVWAWALLQQDPDSAAGNQLRAQAQETFARLGAAYDLERAGCSYKRRSNLVKSSANP